MGSGMWKRETVQEGSQMRDPSSPRRRTSTRVRRKMRRGGVGGGGVGRGGAAATGVVATNTANQQPENRDEVGKYLEERMFFQYYGRGLNDIHTQARQGGWSRRARHGHGKKRNDDDPRVGKAGRRLALVSCELRMTPTTNDGSSVLLGHGLT